MENSTFEAAREGKVDRSVAAITVGRRRQDWAAAEKARIVAESNEPGVNISEVARRNGVSRGLLTVWRRQAREARAVLTADAMFATVRVKNGPDRRETTTAASREMMSAIAWGVIEVSIGDATLRIGAGADGATLDAVIVALRRGR